MLRYEQFEAKAKTDTRSREAYSEYLQGLDWDFFATVTFRRRFRDSIRAHETVWETLSPYSERAFLAVERHRYPNIDCHVHGLIKVPRIFRGEFGYLGGNAPALWRSLYLKHGRSRVEEIRSREDVSAYCAKYVTKALSDYSFYGRPSFWSGG